MTRPYGRSYGRRQARRYILLLFSSVAPCKMRSFRRLTEGPPLPLATPITETTLDGRSPDRQGKVRDIYDFGDRLLIVATDRISAFDYILGSGIPDKGKVLTQISSFWFDRLRSVVPNHVASTDPAAYPPAARSSAPGGSSSSPAGSTAGHRSKASTNFAGRSNTPAMRWTN